MENVLERKADLQGAIDKFNQTSEIAEPLSMSNIRLFPSGKATAHNFFFFVKPLIFLIWIF